MTSQFLGDLKLVSKEFFFVSTLNSKGSVLCSARVGEQLKISRNALLIGYKIGVELNNNVITWI